jgi:replicative DNA helicase
MSLLDRTLENKKIGEYGVKFLDDYLTGIKSTSFVLIGAPTGAGKSQLAYQIAFNNAKDKHVHLFALEADQDEPNLRRAYIEYSKFLRAENKGFTDYVDFSEGKILYPQKLQEIDDELSREYFRLNIHYKQRGFTPDDLCKKLDEIAATQNCEMIVIDHIDYFDLSDDESENSQVTRIMKILRDINIDWGIPVVVVSHLRKKSNRKAKIPEAEDIMGTSNKVKIAKTVILLSPDFEGSDVKEGRFSTFFTIPKDRVRGGTHLIGKCIFNARAGVYEKGYKLMLSKTHGETVEFLEEEQYPHWAEKPTVPRMTQIAPSVFVVGGSHD